MCLTLALTHQQKGNHGSRAGGYRTISPPKKRTAPSKSATKSPREEYGSTRKVRVITIFPSPKSSSRLSSQIV
jgi:hypothetical protein